MKKVIVFLALLFMPLCEMYAQSVMRFVAYRLSVKSIDEWGVWSDWVREPCRVPITMDFEDMRIVIYSDVKQDYIIVENEGENNAGGGHATVMKCIDKDGLLCRIHFRRQDDVLQLYVEYNDLMWMYNIEMK